MNDAYGETDEARIVLAIAGALRDEFGVAIDAHPGGVGSEAGTVNRAFRAAARVVLRRAISPEHDPNAVLSWVLSQTALRHLGRFGMVGERAKALLDSEPALGDRWLAFLALAPDTVIDDLTR